MTPPLTTSTLIIVWGGVALRRQHKHLQALECYQQALKFDSRNEKVHFNLGVGEKDKSLEAMSLALQFRPNFTEAQDFLRRHFSTDRLTAASP